MAKLPWYLKKYKPETFENGEYYLNVKINWFWFNYQFIRLWIKGKLLGIY